MTGFDILEHTADVGVRARGASTKDVFEQATLGLLDITGASGSGAGERVDIEVSANDLAGALVDWLEEVLYLQDARDSVVTGLGVERADDSGARGWVEIVPRDRELEGTAVKAITYHQLNVSRQPDGTWVAIVYLDI
ncbi:MAG: archease [Actinobacteria bacterium]|nr:archease [Actinomycetota bacterium]